ncbi:MAG: hypothetical protein J7K82_05680 [Thermoproteales archaeon]|nr:hypothetical protein [Thermoproteales archaeon]
MEGQSVKLSIDDLRKLYTYALSHCKEVCPAKRDPSACIIMAEIGKMLGMAPPCVEDYGGFSVRVFKDLIKEIEERRGKNIVEILEEIKDKGYKSLQDQIDEIDGRFALDVIEAYKKRNKEKERES